MLNRLAVRLIGKQSKQTIQTVNKRHSSGQYYAYRELNYASNRRWLNPFMEMSMGLVWWWILWSGKEDWRHLVGHYVWPEYETFSNQHLGIPEDHVD